MFAGSLRIRSSSPFELVIKTDNLSTGSTANNQFRIPHYATGIYNYKVDWGDGVVESVSGNTSPTHTYGSIGTYNVRIWGIFHGILFNNTGDRLKLLNIVAVDRLNKQLAFSSSYFNCANLASFPLIDTSGGTNFAYTWQNCTSLTSFPLIDTSSGTNFAYTWFQCSSLTSFPPLDTSSGTSFANAWRQCTSLISFPANFFDTWTGVPVRDCFLDAWHNCNALTTTSVENILVSIDTSGKSAPAGATGTQSDITITYNTATGGLTGATNTAITNLKAKGWTPRINNVYV